MVDEWLFSIVDLLASEYGWAKDYILEHVYIDELPSLIKIISRRNRYKRILDLRIAHNPHLAKDDAKVLIEELQKDPDGIYRPAKLDKVAFNMVRGQLSMSPASKFHVK